MDLPVLIDSNVYIDLLRQGLDPALELTGRISQLDLASCGIVRVEVLRGIKVEKVRSRLAAFFDVTQNVPTDNYLWEEAAELAWTLDRRGKVIPSTDILIACCARRIGATVLTADAHFSGIPGLRMRKWPIG
ncbi:MAG TPA: PIN domain-containing protein [Chthoniobacterales bacterium]